MIQNDISGTYLIEGADLILPDAILPDATLAVHGGRIAHILSRRELSSPVELAKLDPSFGGTPVLHVPDAFVAPALVEMHVHGCGGWGFERIAGPRELLDAAEFLEKKGVGCFVPTLLWDERALSSLVAAIRASNIPREALPGLYLEGPFVNPVRRGGIQPENIRPVDSVLAQKILDAAQGLLKIVTLAPELDGVEPIYQIFQGAGALVSLGHSDAKLQSLCLPHHPYSMTHLFNAMRGVDHKEGGLANLAFSQSPDYVEVNGDGIHVNASCLRLSARAISRDSLILISDAVIGAGLPHGAFRYYEHDVLSTERGVRYADNDILMGSNRLGMDIVREFTAQTAVPLWQAVRAMSLVPRRALGTAKDYGSIEIGKVADIFIWDKEMKIATRPWALLDGGESFSQDGGSHRGPDAQKRK
jgi:N-acetylglucosamine-6-phosphate deacetylase